MIRPAVLFAALAFSCALAGIARGQTIPSVVQKDFESMARDCGADPGKSGKALTSADLNGDGIADWIFDTGAMQCEMASFWCGSAGCTLHLYVSHEGSHALVWQSNAHAWKPTKIGGKAGIQFDLHGSACNRTGSAACRQRYVFQGPRLIPVK